MPSILNCLFPHARAELLRLLFAMPGTRLHVRELTRKSGLSLGTMQVELKKLTAAGLLLSERDGNRLYRTRRRARSRAGICVRFSPRAHPVSTQRLDSANDC